MTLMRVSSSFWRCRGVPAPHPTARLVPRGIYFCGDTPSPFLSPHPVSILPCPWTCGSLVWSQWGREHLRPMLPPTAGGCPQPLVPHQLVPSHATSPLPPGIRHSAQHSSAWVRCLRSSSPWDPALSLSFCFLLFMPLDPAFRPCANALLPANLTSFQGRLHKSSGLVLGARPAGLAVLSSRPRSCRRICWHEPPPKRSQQDAARAARLGGARAAKSNGGQGQALQI